MSNWISRLGWALAVALVAACGGRATPKTGPLPSRDVITREQIARTHAVTALEAVERLRGHWLRLRGTTELPGESQARFAEAQVQVYLDDQKLGTIENLARIEMAAIEYIRFIPPAEASARYGFGHGAGVIFVSTRPLPN